MNTPAYIPWDAIVGGRPASHEAHSKRLPLVVARNFEVRSTFSAADPDFSIFVRQLCERPTGASLSAGWGRGAAMRIESLLYGDETHTIATLTSDGGSSVVLQSLSSSWSAYDTYDPALAIDALVHSYVLRYARLDADTHAFVTPPETDDQSGMRFIKPQNWGFRPTASGTLAWTANRLESPPATPVTVPNKYCSTHPVYLPPHRTPADSQPTPDRGDPLQCLPPLRHVRATLEWRLCSKTHPLHGEPLCYWPALALGRCRLFGVTIDDASDFTLGPAPFTQASGWLLKRLRVIIRWAGRIEQVRTLGGASVDQNLSLELLEARMDAHAAYIALDEAYDAARFAGRIEADAMGRRLHQVRRLIDMLDGNLQKQIPLLRLAAGTRLLENWRRLLAPCYRELPPWWLDGCLEDAVPE